MINDTIIGMWNDGFSMTQISNKLNISVCSIRSVITDAGYQDMISHSEGAKRHYDMQADNKWSDIHDDLSKGMNLSAVQKKYGMTKERLMSLFCRQNFDYDAFTAERQKAEDDALKSRLLSLRNSGKTVKEIADILDKSETTIGRYLLKFGLSKKSDRTDIHTDDIIAYWDKNWSMNMIAKELSCSVDTVSKRLKSAGVTVEKGLDIVKQESFCISGAELLHTRILRIVNDLSNIGIRCELNNRKIIKSRNNRNLEIDIWLPDHNIGIEVNPTFTHSVDIKPFGKRDRNYHQNKSICAEDAGIGLIHLYDADFMDETCYQRFLRQMKCLTIQKTKLGARQCHVREISRQESNLFLDSYHFQGGEHASSVCYGLFYDDLLIGVLTIGRSRYAKADYEIIRYCMHPGYIVVGCFEKLFKAFLGTLNTDADILSYMDLNKRMRAHSVYERHDFEYIGLTPPDYTWYNQSGTKMISRYATMKKNLVSQGFDPSKSEIQIMTERGFVRVFGAGSKKFMYHYRITNAG